MSYQNIFTSVLIIILLLFIINVENNFLWFHIYGYTCTKRNNGCMSLVKINISGNHRKVLLSDINYYPTKIYFIVIISYILTVIIEIYIKHYQE